MARWSVRLLSAVALIAVLLGAWWWTHPRETSVAVYFIRADKGSSTLQDVPRLVRGRGPTMLLAAAMRALLTGPLPSERGAGVLTAVPPGTRLRSLRIVDGVAIVDLSGEIESGGGSSSMLGRFWQVVYTASQFPEAPRVRILIDGQVRRAMGGEGIVIDHPLARPSALPVF